MSADSHRDAEDAFFEGQGAGPAGETFEAQVQRVGRRAPTWRSPLVMVLAAGFAVYLAWGMRAEVAYFFSDPEPIDLGDENGHRVDGARHNRHARIAGLHSLRPIGYTRVTQRYRVNYLLGTRVFVREALPDEDEEAPAPLVDVEEADDYPAYEGTGRLLDFERATDFAHVMSFYREKVEFDFDGAWILLDGVRPREQWQYPLGAAVLLLIAALNVVMLVRWVLRRR